jgi:histidinol dehydrogenase
MPAVGIYVPGGRFSYPSTVLMTAIPALMAGVERVAIVTPPARLSFELLAAAHIAGVTEIYQVGGPAAVAALALGTKTIAAVDMIVGPGNALVTEAKRQLFGTIGIDSIAGPSELVVVADESAPAEFVAADLAAQAEHDPDSRSVLISISKQLIKDVKAAIPKSLLGQCELVYEPTVKRAALKANALAAEHVQIILRNPTDVLDQLKNGGAFFLGAWSPAVMGDYWAGPSHVLPTDRSARFASGLSVMTFLKRSSFIDISSGAFQKGAPAALTIAEKEGLVQHANALRLRQNAKESS